MLLTEPIRESPELPGDECLLALPSIAERALVNTLAFAQRLRLPLADEIRQLAAEFPGTTSDRLHDLAGLVDSGTPLPDALDLTPQVLSPHARLAIRLANETGTLNDVYAVLLDPRGQEPQIGAYGNRAPAAELRRTWLMLAAAWLVLTLQTISILPALKSMFEEFSMQMPAITESLFALSGWLGWLTFAGALLWLAVGLLQFKLAQELSPAWFKPWRWHQRFVPAPIALLPLLALVIDSGRPLLSGLETLAKFHPSPRLRKRLVAATERIGSGSPPWQALAEEQLLSPAESQALAVGGHGELQAWLLRRLADQRFERQLRLRNLLARVLSLTSLLVLAAIVLWIIVGVLGLLYELATGLT